MAYKIKPGDRLALGAVKYDRSGKKSLEAKPKKALRPLRKESGSALRLKRRGNLRYFTMEDCMNRMEKLKTLKDDEIFTYLEKEGKNFTKEEIEALEREGFFDRRIPDPLAEKIREGLLEIASDPDERRLHDDLTPPRDLTVRLGDFTEYFFPQLREGSAR